MLDAAKQEKEREEKERQMRELAERVRQQVIEEEAIKAENTALISRDVYLACNKLFSSNMVQAMTNEICLASFRVNGHPELGRPMPKE